MALSYVDGLTPKKLVIPFEFGSIMHLCLEHQFSFTTPEECAYQVTEQYFEHRQKTLLHSGERDTLRSLCGLAKITFPAYAHFWKHDDDAIDWIAREEKFDIPYEFYVGKQKCNIRLRGMRDGIYRIRKSKKFGVFETKNKSLIKEDEIHDGLKADMQTLFYVFATYLEYGECPSEITYNVIRRSGLYRRKGESDKDYLKRVEADIKKRTNAAKGHSEYFMRWEVTLLPSDVTNFVEKTLNPLLYRLLQWWESVKKNPLGEKRFESPLHFQSLNGLHSKYGMSPFFPKITSGSTSMYYTREAAFPELSDDFQVTAS